MINQTHFDKQSLNCAQIYTMPVNIAIGSHTLIAVSRNYVSLH